jgi:ferric-dicitrate binding protein FerR (iron transport regulator)
MAAVFDQKYLDDHDIIERYLADQLSEAEREGFEAYFLQHPEVVQQMDRTAKLKSALMELDTQGRLQPLVAAKSSRRWFVALVVLGVVVVLAAVIGLLTGRLG